MEFNFSQNSNILEGQYFDLAIQLFLFVAMVFYSVFSLLVYKQVGILNESIQTSQSTLLINLARLQLILSAALLVIIIIAVIF